MKEFGKTSLHASIGRRFFDWVNEKKPNWDDKKINFTFNERVVAFCKDMQEFFKLGLDVELNAIMIGGGNSRLISYDYVHNKLEKQIILLSPKNILRYDVSPDIISLLGCICPSKFLSVKCIPSVEEIYCMIPYDSF